MRKRVISTNIFRRKLIRKLEKMSIETSQPVWKEVAEILSRPRRSRPAVNIGKINRLAEKSEVVIVPGKVLGAGNLNKELTIIAESFSKTALDKIRESGGKAYTLYDIVNSPSLANSYKGLKIII